LTGLRFLLGLWVIMHHLTGNRMLLDHWNRSLPTGMQSLMRGGYLAVQTFFLLSGFVLAQSYANTKWNRSSLTRFAIARFARIYPAYLLSLVLVAWFAIQFVLKAGHTTAQKLAVLGNYAFVLQGWNVPSVGWNTPAWSLSCEFFFYACFPLLLVWLGRCGIPRIWFAFAASMVVPIVLAHSGVPVFWKPVYHLADFVAGITAARFYRVIESKMAIAGRIGFWLSLGSAVAVVLLVVNPHVLDGTIISLNTALRPVNMALLVGLASGGGFLVQLLSTASAEYLGKVSYSMYILHIPLLWWYSAYTSFRWGSAPPFWVGFLFIAVVIAVSIAAYEWVEVPANRWIREWSAARSAVAQPTELRAAA
jgi:peptidoglycan/LPS O-acetylase OafA/YrhL